MKKGKLKGKGRYLCKKCGKLFIIRTLMYGKQNKIPYKLRVQVKKLYHTKKSEINKYDRLHKKTYSTREISKMTGVPKTTVHEIIKDEKVIATRRKITFKIK